MDKHTYLTAMAALLFSTLSVAQSTPSDTSYWTRGSFYAITFSQVSLTHWAAGGESSLSINGFFSSFANYRKDRHKWKNSLDLGYGLLKQGNRGTQKSDDKIDFGMNYGYQMTDGNSKWFFTTSLNFKSQFTKGVSADNPDVIISRFMAPGYLTVGTGIEYSPDESISFSYQPITGKMTFVMDKNIVGTEGAYGVNPRNTHRAELGTYFRFVSKQEAAENINIETRLELFTGYAKGSFGNIDMNLQNTLVMKINKYLSTNLFTQLIYDDDIKIGIDSNKDGMIDLFTKKIQFKNVFGVGFIYQFGDKKEE